MHYALKGAGLLSAALILAALGLLPTAWYPKRPWWVAELGVSKSDVRWALRYRSSLLIGSAICTVAGLAYLIAS